MRYLFIALFLLCGCERYPRNIIEQLNYERELDCKEKTMVKYDLYGPRQTKGCKVIHNYSSDGKKWKDDCGRIGWAYSEIQCGEEKYFGWRVWNNREDEKMIWINGNQYYRSCMYTEDEKDGCEYDVEKYKFGRVQK